MLPSDLAPVSRSVAPTAETAVRGRLASSRLIGIAWMGSMFVAVGDRGTIVTSPDGLTWTDHSFGEAPFALIAGNDVTVFRSIDSGATWQVLGVGLPTATCMSLALDWTRTPSLLASALMAAAFSS